MDHKQATWEHMRKEMFDFLRSDQEAYRALIHLSEEHTSLVSLVGAARTPDVIKRLGKRGLVNFPNTTAYAEQPRYEISMYGQRILHALQPEQRA